MNSCRIDQNEEGFVLVAAMLALLVLVVMGTAALTITNVELNIAGNTREAIQEFYVAESSWQQGANWLIGFAKPPAKLNSSGSLVRNFGAGAADVLNETFPAGTADGSLGGVPYWYRAAKLDDHATQGSGKDYRDFYYTVTGNADGEQQIDTVVRKVYKVGY